MAVDINEYYFALGRVTKYDRSSIKRDKPHVQLIISEQAMSTTQDRSDDSQRSVCWKVLNEIAGFAGMPHEQFWPVLMVSAIGASKSGEMYEDDLKALVGWADEAQNRARMIQQILLGTVTIRVVDGELIFEPRTDEQQKGEAEHSDDAVECYSVSFPDCELAAELATRAITKVNEEDIPSAIALIEEAIRLDSIAALDRYHRLRADFYELVGEDGPSMALEMYIYAATLQRTGRFRDASIAYREAANLDELFLWPLNNLAWMLSTSTKGSARNGQLAVKCAEEVCQKSNWSCWAFLGTLAAAWAENGDFERAVGWQKASLKLVPADHRRDAELILRCFQLGQSYVDEGMPVAAGERNEYASDSQEILHPEKVSTIALRTILDGAFFDTELDEDGTLWIRDHLNLLVKPTESGEQITVAVLAPLSARAPLEECVEFVNRVNTSVQALRAALHENRLIVFDYTISVAEGLRQTHSFTLSGFSSRQCVLVLRHSIVTDYFSRMRATAGPAN